MNWKDLIKEALLAKSKNKGSHELTVSDFCDYIESKGFPNNLESQSWKDEVKTTIHRMAEEGLPLIKKTNRDTYILDATTQDEFTAKIYEYSYGESGTGITRKEAIEKMMDDNFLKPADFLTRPSRKEFWYKQNVGNAMRPSKRRAEMFSVVFDNDAHGHKTIAARETNSERISREQQAKLPKKVIREVFLWVRNKSVVEQAKALATYGCEFGCDMAKDSFIGQDGESFTVAHHIIPMGAQAAFEENIDIIDNMVVLCSKHHDEVHYSNDDDKKIILNKIFDLKKDNDFFKDKTYADIERFYNIK